MEQFSHYPVGVSTCSRCQENPCVQRLTLGSMAQENANKTKTTNKIHNFNEYSTSSDLIMLNRSMLCYWEAFGTTPCPLQH